MFCNVGTVLVTSGFYWISAALYAIMDFTQKPAFFMKYKIQPTKNIPPDTKRLLKVTSIGMIKMSYYTRILIISNMIYILAFFEQMNYYSQSYR